MRKSQKILLWVFGAVFILPEILWSTLGNFLYSFFMPTIHGSSQILRNNFLSNPPFYFLYKIILLVQLVSIIVFTISLAKSKNNFKSKLVYWLLTVLAIFLSIITFVTCYLVYAVSNMSFP